MAEAMSVTNQAGKSIDEAIEGLRWCRQHVQERGVTQRLRQLQITLSALALALDYEMDGQTNKAELALDHADWRVRPKYQPFSNWTFDVH
jgi:hypothetical protein